MKANFIIKKNNVSTDIANKEEDSDKKLSQKEFEEFIIKSGAKGSFMVYRSDEKKDELGIDEL